MADLQKAPKSFSVDTHGFSPLEPWSDLTVSTRKCTQLYPLEPMAYGTPDVEALSSFVGELADLHCVSVNDLVSMELAKLMRPDSQDTETRAESHTTRNIGFSEWALINSAGGLVSKVVSALERATGLDGLEYLTMLPLSGYVRSNMTHERRRWCAICLKEFRKTRRPFEPLLWSVSTVLVCPVHRVPLEQSCPDCGRDSIALHRLSRPGHCPRCGAWLGSDSSGQPAEIESSDPLVTAARLTRDLVACLPMIPRFSGNNVVRSNLKRLIDISVDGNQSAFFRVCGLPRPSDIFGRNLPSLKMLTSISVRLDIPLKAFFNADTEESDMTWQAAVNRMDKTKLNSLRSLAKKTIRLQRAVDAWPPVSLDSIAQELGYRSTIPLYRTDRNLATSIQMRYLEWSKNAPINDQEKPKIKSDAVCRALESALLEDEPTTVAEIAKHFGFFDPRLLGYYYPELCAAISRKRKQYKDAQVKRMETMLSCALDEDPVPSLSELSRRWGLKYFNLITDRFPELSAALVQRRNEQRSKHIQAIRNVLEEILRDPHLTWNEVLQVTGLSRGTLRYLFPDLAARISSKSKDSLDAKRAALFDIAKNKIQETFEELRKCGTEPSAEAVWSTLPRLPYHGKSIVKRVLRTFGSQATEPLSPYTN